jgi:hypothetical protein
METFEATLKYVVPFSNNIPASISGGEPFEHPQIKEILERAVGKIYRGDLAYTLPIITVITNGACLLDDKQLYSWYKDFVSKNRNVYTQITNLAPYYPRVFTQRETYWLSKLKNVTICNTLDQVPIYPQGRALDLPDKIYQTKGPKCINTVLLSIQKNFDSEKKLYSFLGQNLYKFCVPRINIDGSIALGESRLCPTYGTVFDGLNHIDDIRNWNCHKCEFCWDKLTRTRPEVVELLDHRKLFMDMRERLKQ